MDFGIDLFGGVILGSIFGLGFLGIGLVCRRAHLRSRALKSGQAPARKPSDSAMKKTLLWLSVAPAITMAALVVFAVWQNSLNNSGEWSSESMNALISIFALVAMVPAWLSMTLPWALIFSYIFKRLSSTSDFRTPFGGSLLGAACQAPAILLSFVVLGGAAVIYFVVALAVGVMGGILRVSFAPPSQRQQTQ